MEFHKVLKVRQRFRLILLVIAAVALFILAFKTASILGVGKAQEEKELIAELPLSKAIIDNQSDKIAALMASEDLSATDALGRTALHIAAFYGHLAAIEALLEKEVKLEETDGIGMTALHAAALSGGRQAVLLLLAKGAQIEAATESGQTALHLAAATGQPRLTQLLLDNGANLQAEDKAGKKPLFYAKQNRHPQTAAVLAGAKKKAPAQETPKDATS